MSKDAHNKELHSKKRRKVVKPTSSSEPVVENDWIDAFTLKNLSTGTRLLGLIVQVTSLKLKISLPNMMSGYCELTDISQSYRQYLEAQKSEDTEDQETEFNTLEHLFQPGQYVLCSVKSVETKYPYKVSLSIDPEVTQAKFSAKDLVPGMVVSASVVSHEDHGIQFSFGVKNQTGFLPSSEAAANGEPLPVGRVVLATIHKVSGRVATLTLKKRASAQAPSSLSSIDSLNPGLLVDGKVENVFRNGVGILVMGFFHCTVSRLHIPQGDSDDWATHYSIGASVRARLMLVDVTSLTKTIQLSLLPHVIDLQYPQLDQYPAGHLFNKAVIVRAETNHGLVCVADTHSITKSDTKGENSEEDDDEEPEATLNATEQSNSMEDSDGSDSESDSNDEAENGSDSESEAAISEVAEDDNMMEDDSVVLPRLYALANAIKDATSDADPLNLKSFKVGHSLPARVLGHFDMEGLLKVSLQPSVVKKDYPMFETLKIGQLVSGTVTVIKPGLGVAVRLSAHAPSAFIPILHASDFATSTLEKKFTVGQKINCRVLCLDPETSNIHLTCKKTLMQSKLPLVTNFEDAAPGVSTHGVLLKVLKTGCVVGLWNRITAFIPLSEMFSGPAEDPTSSFRAGQVIQCSIKNVNPPKITASLLDLSDIDLASAADQLAKINVGEHTSGEVTTVTPDALVLTLKGGAKGILPFVHLSDHLAAHSSKLIKTFPIGSTVTDVIVFAKQPSKGQVILSAKPLLLAYSKSDRLATSIADFKVGDVIPGVINGINDRGIFVNFLGSISGLAESEHLALPKQNFRVGQTVLSFVKRVEAKRLLLSLNSDDVNKQVKPKDSLYRLAFGSNFVISYFDELNRISTHNKSKSKPVNTVYCPGQMVSAKLVAKQSHGWKFKLNEFDALMMGDYLKDIDLEVGSSLDCKVLDFNPKMIDISAKKTLISTDSSQSCSDLIPPVSKKDFSALSKSVASSTTLEAEIELVKDDYAVVSLPSFGHCLAFVPVKSYNDHSSPFKRFQCGQSISIRIVKAQRSEPRILAEMVDVSNTAPVVSKATPLNEKEITLAKIIRLSVYNLELKAKINEFEHPVSIHATHVYDNYSCIDDPYQPFSTLFGNEIECRLLSAPTPSSKTTSLCALTRVTQSDQPFTPLTYNDFSKGKVVLGFVKNASSMGIFVSLTPKIHGLIRPLDISSDFEVVNNYEQLFVPGMAIECRVLKNKDNKIQLGLVRAKVHLSEILIDVPAPYYKLNEYKSGQAIVAQLSTNGVRNAIHTGWFPVNIPSGLASVHITDCSDDFDTELLPHQYVKAYVLEVVQVKPYHLRLSLRNSCFHPGQCSVKDQEVNKISDLVPEQKLRGFVLSDGSVALGREIVEQLPSHYHPLPVGEFISLNVDNVNLTSKKIELSTQTGKQKASNGGQLSPGNEIDCTITKIPNSGLQVQFNDQVRGFIPNAQLPCLDGVDIKNKVAVRSRVTSLYSTGMSVKAWFLKKEPNSVILSLRRPPQDDAMVDGESDTEIPLDGEDQFDPEDVLPLEIDTGFQWNIQTGPDSADDDQMDVSDLEAEVEASLVKPVTKTKRSHNIAFNEDKTADVHAPEVASDFEKALLSSPNSSFVWIQYMAYYLQQAAVAPARAVGLRALSSISVREEQERFNIHVALLNLEFKFGDAESLEKSFQSSRIMVNDPKSLYFQLAKLYSGSERFAEAEATYRAATKKYSQSPETWGALMTFFLERGQLEDSRQTLQRSLQSLPKREHLPAIFQAAQLEFKHGEIERARTLFEGILANNPKRLDIWNVYLDKEIQLLKKSDGSADADVPRRLFRRILKLKWSAHKMKFLFKKFLGFEKLHGQAHHVDHAKGLALAYVQQLKE